jgi:sugar lactone lactonase YvrE
MKIILLQQKVKIWPKIILIITVVFLTAAQNVPFVLKEMVRGSPIHGANGVMFDAQDNLYIASVFGREILVMNPLNGKVIDRLGTGVGVEGPDDLTFGPDGSLYWTSIATGEVGRLSPEGEKTGQFVAPGVNPITFSEEGRLFVALDFFGDGLYELDPDLTDPPRPIIVATEENPFPLGFLNGFDFGPDGRLYGPLFAVGIVVSIDVDSCENTSNPWVDCDIQVVAGGFTVPAAAKFDSQGRLHVVDQSSGEVFRVDRTTGEKTVIATLSPGLDNLAFDSTGNLVISNAHDGSVTRLLPSGQGRILSEGGMILPGGVAVIPRPHGGESVFVGDVWTLREFNGRTGRPVSFTSVNLVEPDLVAPLSLSEDGDHLVISSWVMNAVQVWDPQAGQVIEHYPMAFPLNAIRFQEDLVVADLGLGGVVWASTQEMILGGPNVFVPIGLAASEDTLWVADWATGIVWQVGFDGKTPLPAVPVASGLVMPEGLALDLDGSLLVVEAGAGRLSRIDLTTGEVSVLTEGLELGAPAIPGGTPPTFQFNGVTVGPSGAIYVTGDVTNVLYRIWPR